MSGAAHTDQPSAAPLPLANFASDNYAGAHPEALEALARVNTGHVPAYGDDPETAALTATLRGHFGDAARVYPVFNGTGANVVSLAAITPRWGAVVCVNTAHIQVDEGGAPEKSAGVKLLTSPSPDGKLTPDAIVRASVDRGNPHAAQPCAVSVSQSTELGTVYTPEELAALAHTAHDHGMLFHIDGSRLGNAAASLGCSLAAITTDVDADIVSLGGTKNGLLGAEAVVVLNPDIEGLEYLRKHHMQLASKMRFVSAQLNALYGSDLWRRSAEHANRMAARLSAGLLALADAHPESGIAVTQRTQANGVFARIPEHSAAAARTRYHFYDWPVGENERRLMCAFDTSEADVDGLLAAIREAVAG